jgi:uncharacterized protein YdaU (DUF1376 family)
VSKPEKPPAFQFYPKDWLSDSNVARMPFAVKGMYIDLIAITWLDVYIPSDPAELAAMLKASTEEMTIAYPHLERCFRRAPRKVGVWIHPRLEKEREVQSRRRKARSVSGASGAKARWDQQNGDIQNGSQIRDLDSTAIDSPMAKDSSSSSSSSSSSLVLSESPSEISLAADAARSNGAHRTGPPPCPHEDIVALYHEILPELARIKDWTDLRQGLLRSRWREKPERQDLTWWRRFFEFIRTSPFLMGNAKAGFQGDLEWFVRPSNFVKILEGKYHRDQRFNAA